MDPIRRVRIFKNGSNQAIRKEGKRLVIEPVERPSLLELLSTWRPLGVRFPDIRDAPPEPVEL